jgi:hypothetical protein
MKILKTINRKNIMAFSFLLLALMFTNGCKKLVEVPAPTTELTSNNVYTSNATAISVLTGIYTQMSGFNPLGLNTSLYPGLSADEFSLLAGTTNTEDGLYYQDALTNSVNDFWSPYYQYIYFCNAALSGLQTATSLNTAVQQQLTGEAQFMRAFFYFYLVNLYGDVPLSLSTDYKANASLGKTPAKQVYQQIISDLLGAQKLLSKDFRDATLLSTSADRVRPSYWAATALLARVYLYYGNLTNDQSQYTNAANEATELIQDAADFSLSNLNNAFLAASLGNNEAIWQIQPTQPGVNTIEANQWVLPAAGPSQYYAVYLNNDLVNAFEPNDQRKLSWTDSVSVANITYYYPYKYKIYINPSPVTEYEMVLRLGEQYLIRAEAEAELGQSSEAQADLNAIRTRAGLPNTTAASQTDLLAAILRERRVELFTEWGSRWLDLKRTGNVNTVMSTVAPQKGGTWSSYKQLYPIPLSDIKADPNLQQNAGY